MADLTITSVGIYRDGGTIYAVLIDGSKLCVDQRIGTKTPDALFAGYPRHDSTPIAGAEDERVGKIIQANKLYSEYHRLRVAERGRFYDDDYDAVIARIKEHRAKDLSYSELISSRNEQ